MSTRLTPDICIIGAGSGGLTAAAAAVAFGAEVVLIEKGRMGGDCLNYGCVPSKAMIAAARHARHLARAAEFGILPGDMKVDFRKVHAHVHDVIASITPTDSVERFRALGVQVIEAEAKFRDPRTVVAGDLEIAARRFIVAAGSRPAVPPIPGLDQVDFLTNETIFERTRLPRHLVVIGGGPIGVELAQAHVRLGAEVTVIEADRLLPREDAEAAAIVLDALRADGVTVHQGVKVARLARRGRSGVRVGCEAEDGSAFHVDGSHLLLATGRTPNVEGLGLEEAGIRHDKRGIRVGRNLKSSNSRVFAIGDIAGGLQFTHVAGYHAGLVLQQILFRLPAREKREIVPRVTYTDPEIAHVGLGEEEARARHGRGLRILRWPLAENDRARAERETAGHIKLIADRKARILGVTIVAPGAGEMISMWALAVSAGLKLSDVRNYIPPYPTVSEIGKRAAVAYYAPMTRKPFVQWLVRFLRKFG